VDVRKLHPQYLQSSATADIIITQTADVWITFVSEGAGYLNSVGYYTYPTNSPPQSPADINTVNYIFPNASLPGSGGNLKSGSKVKLGRFNAGTSIGFILLANAWNGGSQTVNSNATKFYSTTACNPETDPNLKKHTVLLYSTSPNLFLIGFDDQNRQTGGSDNDFNDVVFYATSNPVTAISTTNVEPIDKPVDSDGDGVTDTFDQFPNDPTRAYISYYPSQTTFGTLLFEDLWPATGDYDMNDMVVGYRYKTITNAQNQAVEIYADYMVEASGASYVSGFGVQFPFSASKVKTVTGQKLVGGYIKQNANGTEASQSNAVIIPFDSYKAIIQRPGGYYINTQNGAPYITGDTLHVYMSFTNPISASTLGNAPFNPFLISNQRRGYEVHLANTLPTDLADKKLFGTLQDNTNPAMGNYYLSKKSWPWALNFAAPFDYSAEGISIGKSYNYFLQWAQSGGTLHKDWYLNNPGNRNESMIYKK
jgi:LruC domain-containing protein